MLYVKNTYQDMDSFEINKIIASILLTALIIIGIGKIVDILFYIEKPKVSAYKVEGIDQSGTGQEVSELDRLPGSAPRDSGNPGSDAGDGGQDGPGLPSASGGETGHPLGPGHRSDRGDRPSGTRPSRNPLHDR